MTIYILTLFPQIFESVFQQSIVAKAQKKNLLTINFINLRDFGYGKHKQVDDKPYGGGPGMLLKVDVVVSALESIKSKPTSVLLSASGSLYSQKVAKKLSKVNSLALICGHYEGTDARVEKYVNKIISIGDFILTGGEIAAMTIVDSISRLIPQVIRYDSKEMESFSRSPLFSYGKSPSLLEYPQYTRPQNFRGAKVPKILITGNHEKIEKWRKEQMLLRTKKYRPDLLKA